MPWNDPLTTHLLDFIFELEKNGLKTPLTVAGGFGLFLKRQYLTECRERTLFDYLPGSRSTEDVDVFVRVDILCDVQQARFILDALRCLNYVALKGMEYMQWKKTIEFGEQTGTFRIDFLVGNIDAHRKFLYAKKPPRVRNPHVEGFHAYNTPEALLIDEKAQEISLSGKRSNGESHTTSVCIPHPFTYLLMKLFAFHERTDGISKQHHAFDVFSIIGSLTEQELDESIEFGKIHVQEPVFQKAKQIVKDNFTGTSPEGMIAIQTHNLFRNFEARHCDVFLKTLTEIFTIQFTNH